MNTPPDRAIASLSFAIALVVSAAAARAQAPRFNYPAPPAQSVSAMNDVQYASADTTRLAMDVYRPAAAANAAPALIFFNVATGADRRNEFYQGWARVAAANGVVGIVPDLRSGRAENDFRLLVAHLVERASSYGIDKDAIAVYAGSGNVFNAFPAVEDPRMTGVKAAVMYYGTGPVTQFRRDLPVLYVRAGLDRPGVNGGVGSTSGIIALATLAIAQNAPVTLLNNPGGHHGFELSDDDAATRDVIDRTIDFVKRATVPAYQAALRSSLPEAAAAAHVVTRDFHAASLAYAELVASHPADNRLRLSYGEALLGDAQYAAACAEFEKLKGKGLGPRDLGLPAARACLRKGDPDAAIAWLRTIPSRFLPPSVANDPDFADLRENPAFRALFQREPPGAML